MDQFTRLFSSFTIKQRVSIALAAVVAIALIVSISHWNSERDFRPLYTGLSQEDAAAVLTKVRENGSEFRLGEGGTTVLVPSAKVAELRLQLAAAGVPKSGRIGFELFDKANFGTSDFAEQVNYHRALEGELERSVMSLTEVEQARVHLTFPKDSVFLESRQPAKASVLVKLRPGGKLSPQNVAAICQLTASAVEGLAPEAVSLVDMQGNLLNRPRHPSAPDDPAASEANLEYRQKIERDLVSKINSTLEPLLGSDKFRANALVECDFTSGDQSEETFDPTKSVMVSSQKTEEISGANLASGVPGTASNLPRPAARPGSGTSGVTRRTESIGYQSSRTVRHVKLPEGMVKRISVSLIVDHSVRWEGTGAKAKKIIEAPSPEKLKSIHDLVAGVIGFSQERGDQLIVESLPFESTIHAQPVEQLPSGPPAAPPQAWPGSFQELLKNKTLLIGAGGGLLAMVLLIAVLVKMLGRRGKAARGAVMTPQLPAANTPEANLSKSIEAQLAERAALKQQQELEALSALKLPPVTTKKTEVLTKHVAEQAKKDAPGAAQVLRTWMADAGVEK
jgi:flagellar M-ring protein FliF